MKRSRKPTGDSELTRFKILWRDSLSESTRDYWRALLVSTTTQPEIRKELFAKLKINLHRNDHITIFQSWLDDQDKRDREAERQVEDERRTMAEHPDWTKDQVRDDVLKKTYFRSSASGDYKLGLSAMDRDVKIETLKFDQEKFKEGLRTKLESAFNELAVAVKGNPVAEEHIRKARELIAANK